MKKPLLIWLAILVLLVFTVFLLSCEKNYITQAPEEHVGDYHLFLYSITGGAAYDSIWALEYSTKTGEIIDTIKTPFWLIDLIYSTDGTSSALRIYDENGSNTVLAINNITGDTLASNFQNIGGRLFLSPDEQTLMLANGGNFALLAFPNLDSIYIEEINAHWGGFMTDGQKAFYMVSGIDSLFFIDFSDAENIIKTSMPINSVGLPAYPITSVVDSQNDRLILICEYGDDRAFIRVYDSNDFTVLKRLDLPKKYNVAPAIRPGTNEIFLAHQYQLSDDQNYVDVYNTEINVLSSFISSEDIRTVAQFKPYHIEFTPDGNMMYINLVTGFNFRAVLGINPNNKSVIQYLQPEYSDANIIRINPIDYSE